MLLAVALAAVPQFEPGAVRTFQALEGFITTGQPSAEALVDEHVAPLLVERAGRGELIARLATLRGELDGAELDDRYPDGEPGRGICFVYRAGRLVELVARVSGPPDWSLTDAWLVGGTRLDPDAKAEPVPPPLTWENLEERVRMEEAAGLSGALVIVRGGEHVLDVGFGLANREKGIACTPETIFAIGSTPIDFTRAGILLLAQDGQLGLEQPITDYFDDVPADKHGITLHHLMEAQSGLEDFHELPTDTDPDHMWITREESVRRILAKPLLFPPGRGRQHSHSAWGLLAAVIELVSGMSYEEFTRELLFAPAEMQDTGFNGEAIPADRLAVGYGERSDGEPNAPPSWGRTSWLVMGSGGMTSTTGDMIRWHEALRAGKILNGEWLARYWGPGGGLLNGGDVFGYEIFYTEATDPRFVLITNSAGPLTRRRFSHLARDVAALR